MNRPKLLLADDSATIRKVVEFTFADENVDVTTVQNGEEAMQKFIEVQPDIVLADVNMPDPTGYQICEMIKQDDATRHIPVLLLVGSFEPFDQDEAERVGADGFMVKPFKSTRDLVSMVSELLGTDQMPEATTAEFPPETAEETADIVVESSEFVADVPYIAGETTDITPESDDIGEVTSDFTAESDDIGEVTPDFTAESDDIGEVTSNINAELAYIAEETSDIHDESTDPVEEPSDVPADVPAETSDIDNLYASSFAETYRVTTDESTDIYLGNAGMDDEMIETFQPVYDDEGGAADPTLAGAETSKGFDISLEAFDDPIRPANGGFEPKFRIEDDEVPTNDKDPEVQNEDSYVGDAFTGFELEAVADGPEVSDALNPFSDVVPDGSDERNEISEIESDTHEVRDTFSEAGPQYSDEQRNVPDLPDHFDIDTLSDMEPLVAGAPATATDEPSEEFIALVARRVVEMLSDRVVRDIAREAVPRIAENLIREALEEDRK